MEISLKNLGFGLLLLVAVLVLVNIFAIMPFLTVKPVQIPSILEEIAESVKPADVVLTVDSLALIKKSGTGEGVIHLDSDNQTLRNPFFWPEEKKQPPKVQETAAAKSEVVEPAVDKPEPEKPQLSMVIISKGRKQALLGDVFIKEGDMFHGYLVKRLVPDEVILSGNLGDLSIFLTTVDEESGQELPPGGVIEKQFKIIK